MSSNMQNMERIAMLVGPCENVKSKIIGDIGALWLNKGYEVEFMNSPLDTALVNGVINPKLRCGVVDGTPPHQITPKALGVVEEYVSFMSATNRNYLEKYKDEIIAIGDEKNKMLASSCNFFHEALAIHDEWEKIYIENMDFDAVNRVALELEDEILKNKSIEKDAIVRDRFLGASTPEGPIHFISNLTEGLNKRYFIKGRPGTGKSTVLRKVLKAAREKGFDVESYHCGFDPDSLDMIILKELGVAIYDSTHPHECFPEVGNDEIIDMYKECVKEGTDEKYKTQLDKIAHRYKEKIKEGTEYLRIAKGFSDDLEEIYLGAIDFARINQIKFHLLRFMQKY
jgi:hypothetical protein